MTPFPGWRENEPPDQIPVKLDIFFLNNDVVDPDSHMLVVEYHRPIAALLFTQLFTLPEHERRRLHILYDHVRPWVGENPLWRKV
jgi:hypothetical protein